MKTILVTGSNGLLGQKIIYQLCERTDVRCISTSKGTNRMKKKSGYTYHSLDVTDSSQITEAIQIFQPDVIIHTAALTNVDACETKREEAWQTNVESVDFLVDTCTKHNIHLIQLSTDFVFDGTNGPYIETDEPNPLSFYAHTKYEAEKRLMASSVTWTIIRTIIIYGVVDDNSRSNVVLWTINSLKNKKEITVINDQFRSPTLAEDLADACVQAAVKKVKGLFHVSGREVMNILDIAKITADYFELDQNYIKPVSSAELKQPAQRPPVTGFIINKAMDQLDFSPHTFIEGLAEVKKQLILVGGI